MQETSQTHLGCVRISSSLCLCFASYLINAISSKYCVHVQFVNNVKFL